MKAVSLKTTTQPIRNLFAAPQLRECCLIPDGNSHRPDLCLDQVGFVHSDLVCEAMLPEIRAVAMMIAAERHDFSARSPSQFADESDWFAARILVLQAREFHLDISLKPMLDVANHRAEVFAMRHGLTFVPAKIRSSLHAGRPNNMLLVACALSGEAVEGMVQNSRLIRRQLIKFA